MYGEQTCQGQVPAGLAFCTCATTGVKWQDGRKGCKAPSTESHWESLPMRRRGRQRPGQESRTQAGSPDRTHRWPWGLFIETHRVPEASTGPHNANLFHVRCCPAWDGPSGSLHWPQGRGRPRQRSGGTKSRDADHLLVRQGQGRAFWESAISASTIRWGQLPADKVQKAILS